MYKSPSQYPECMTIQLLPENCLSPMRREIPLHRTAYSRSQFVFLPTRRCLERKEAGHCSKSLSLAERMPETVNMWPRINGDRNWLPGDRRGRRETINALLQSFKKLVVIIKIAIIIHDQGKKCKNDKGLI